MVWSVEESCSWECEKRVASLEGVVGRKEETNEMQANGAMRPESTSCYARCSTFKRSLEIRISYLDMNLKDGRIDYTIRAYVAILLKRFAGFW